MICVEPESWEYGIVHSRHPDELHRGPMSGSEAERWIREFVEDGGRDGAFTTVHRFVSKWESCDLENASPSRVDKNFKREHTNDP